MVWSAVLAAFFAVLGLLGAATRVADLELVLALGAAAVTCAILALREG